jgi:hypothetical protein
MLLLVELWWVERCPLREGAAGRTLVMSAAAWELSIDCIIQASQPHPPPPPDSFQRVRIESTTGNMSQPVVQTIHRDPALLYVDG